MSWSSDSGKGMSRTREGGSWAAPTGEGSAWQRLREDGGNVVIESSDEDRFVVPIDAVVRACRNQERVGAFVEQIRSLLVQLHAWLLQRSSEIDRAHLSIEPEWLMFVVVRKDKRFNPDFEDALSELHLRSGE